MALEGKILFLTPESDRRFSLDKPFGLWYMPRILLSEQEWIRIEKAEKNRSMLETV